MRIGSYNIFEVDSKINSSDIGDFNHFEHQCNKIKPTFIGQIMNKFKNILL